MGTPAAGCVVVGDAVDDIRMATAARMVPVGVGYGVATLEQLAAAGAVAVAPFGYGAVGRSRRSPRADKRRTSRPEPVRPGVAVLVLVLGATPDDSAFGRGFALTAAVAATGAVLAWFGFRTRGSRTAELAEN